MLEKLKNLNLDRIDLDEAVSLLALGRMTQSGYKQFDVPSPHWLNDVLDLLEAEVLRRRREMLAARKKEIAAQLTSLESPAERRKKLEAEAARIDSQLGA